MTRRHSPENKRHGFSLVELSIVLVILGLLVGGVLSGQSLIHASELRATITQISTLNTAFNSFKDRYFCLPGDCANATSMGMTAVNGIGPNGNGDGILAQGSEEWDATGLLAQKQLLSGATTDAGYSSGAVFMKPKVTSIASSGYQAYWIPITFTQVTNASVPSGSYYWLDSINGTSTTPGVLTTQDAWGLDAKIDDGQPRTGGVVATGSGQTYASLVINPTFVAATDATAAGSASNPQCITSALSYNVQNTNNAVCSITVKASF